MKSATLMLSLLLAACTSTLVDYESRSYVVARGDTLYTIAFRYGIDQRDLARWNGIADPNRIYVGQRLVLRPPVGMANAPAVRRPAAVPVPAAGRSAPSTRAAPPGDPIPAWQWPTRGPIVSPYGSEQALASGVGIGGQPGQTINAAAAGRVVYAGSGLIGYGQLVIIKHNETYLTAYGHNSRLLVTQGQEVERGQKIAEMGLGPGRQPQLHFEIRRNGVPIDPMPYLLSAG